MSNADQHNSPPRQPSPPLPSTSSGLPGSRLRPPDLSLFDTHDLENPLPSPPYKRDPSHSNLYFGTFAEDSPAYRSRSDSDITDELSPMVNEKHDVHARSESDTDNDEHHKRTKTARFQEDVISPSATDYSRFVRTDTDESDVRSVSPSIADTDEDNDYYDWSGEDDLVDEEAKFEENMGVSKKKKMGFRRYIALIFGSLLGSTILSGILITPALLVHFYWYKPHPDSHRLYVKDNLEAWLFWIAANLTISWHLALAIDVAPIIVRYVISAFWGHVSESVKTRTELYNSVKNTIKPLFYAASVWVSWVIIFANIYGLYDMDESANSRAQYTIRLYQVVELTFFCALVICIQQMLSHAIAFSFHRTAYKERLEKLEEALRVIEHLRTYRPKRSHIKSSSQGFGSRSLNGLNLPSNFAYGSRPGTPPHAHTSSRPMSPLGSRSPSPPRAYTIDELGMRKESASDAEDGSPTLVRRRSKGKGKGKAHVIAGWFNHDTSPQDESESPMSQRNQEDDVDSPAHQYPPTPRRRKWRVHESSGSTSPSAGEALGTAARALKTAVLHDARNIEGRDTAGLGGLAWGVSSSSEAKRLARSIYAAFRAPTRTYLIPSDLYPAYATHDEAEAAFRVFDADNNGDVSRGEIKTTLIRVYKERRLLSKSMRDVSQALRTLKQILLFFAMVILLFISLSVFQVNVESSLTSLYSLGIGLSFIFKNSASNAFDAIIFLFVTHPYDTGDRCFIDDENLVVKKMGLFATVFQRADGTESYYFNSQLFGKFITNARRSDKTAEGLTLQVHWRTPWEKLDSLIDSLNAWLETEPNRWFQTSTSMMPQHIDYMRSMEVTIGIGHNSNWQDWGLRLARRTAFNAAVNYYCRLLGITAYESTIPVAYTDPNDPQEITAYPGEEELYDADYESDMLSQDRKELASEEPALPAQEPKEMHRPALLGFQPPPDKPMPGVRIRRAKNKKAMMHTMGADG